jgi:hypothetical protein
LESLEQEGSSIQKSTIEQRNWLLSVEFSMFMKIQIADPCYVMAIPIYQTEIVKDKIHTVAVTDKMDFEMVLELGTEIKMVKRIPFWLRRKLIL